jgi:hypothetical protein
MGKRGSPFDHKANILKKGWCFTELSFVVKAMEQVTNF